MDNRLKFIHESNMLELHSSGLNTYLIDNVGKELDENILHSFITDIQHTYERLNVQYDLHLGVDPAVLGV